MSSDVEKQAEKFYGTSDFLLRQQRQREITNGKLILHQHGRLTVITTTRLTRLKFQNEMNARVNHTVKIACQR